MAIEEVSTDEIMKDFIGHGKDFVIDSNGDTLSNAKSWEELKKCSDVMSFTFVAITLAAVRYVVDWSGRGWK